MIAAALVAASGAPFAQTVVGGAMLIDTATVINGTVNPTTSLIYVNGGPAAPVPEPETYALFAAGLGALALFSRRQKRRR